MSRKQRVMLTLKVKTPLPAGWTQKQLVEHIQLFWREKSPHLSPETQVKLVGREVTYL